MGGPKASSAIRTISIARTTPAQNPRGFSKSKVFGLSDTIRSFILSTLRIHFSRFLVARKAIEKNRLGQRKCKKWEELALRGEKAGLNGGGQKVSYLFSVSEGV